MASRDLSPRTELASSLPLADALPTGGRFDNLSATAMLRAHDYGNYREGDCITPHGIVSLYDQGRLTGEDEHTRLDVVAGGRLYIGSWDRTFTDRFLVTLARRFAEWASADASGTDVAAPPVSPPLGMNQK
jgi:hypothetical protein